MITNPNTLGLFETQIKTITDLLHAAGALVYLDGANMNAILGITRPGDFGADMQHYNVHKTFTGPHGGGGPGSGPIAVRDFLAPYLPAPIVVKDGDDVTGSNFDMPKSIGRVRSFFGNVGILFRGYCYIRTLGPDGLKEVSEQAVLNANYLRARVERGVRRAARRAVYARVRRQRPRHCSASGRSGRWTCASGSSTSGSTPRRCTSRWSCAEALMMEPTETESKETLDAFADALLKIKARGRRSCCGPRRTRTSSAGRTR